MERSRIIIMENWKKVMGKASLKTIMKTASAQHLVIPAFNIPYLPMMEAVIEALKEIECFALIEVARPDITRFEARSFAAIKKEFDRCKDTSVARLHQDHVPVLDEEGKEVDWKLLVTEAIDLGYDSVMIDGSRLSLEENISISKEVVDIAHPVGVLVEAELGAVMGHESGPMPPYDEIFASGKGFTSPEEAVYMVQKTGIDWLSVAIGNIHGAITGAAKDQKKVQARLNIEHLKKLVQKTGIPLVLHGGSGVQKEYVLQAIQNGITKINVGTEIRQTYEKAYKESGNNIQAAQKALKEKTKEILNQYYEMTQTARKIGEALS
ncbi:MAG: Fructose-bisphosphate aldolase [Candidatus Atribacteria bacterium ADurb.Bin276]|uniref:Fructose-bisphosphate aldolase n=1 Tax=Candidatus Atribacter allofermentans TaxID=1852833 RepID=A0A1V5SVC1_9BACT|nr:MAG: Fructose-bisphosphate aldolase [Candidatus Atribacteria bacterium ADurb.Bin276]